MSDPRKYYRKQLRSTGRMVADGRPIDIVTVDISITGIKIHVNSDPHLSILMPVKVYLDFSQSEGKATVVWIRSDYQGGWYIGLNIQQSDTEFDLKNKEPVCKLSI